MSKTILNGVRVKPDYTIEKFTTEKNLWEELGYYVDLVRTGNMHEGRQLLAVVDDEGILKRKKPNLLGTLFSMCPSTLVGDVIFMMEGFTEDGPDLVEMSEEELESLYVKIMNFYNSIISQRN